jgi:hypothetical protein
MGLNYYCAMSKLDPMLVPSRLGGNDTVMPPDVFRAVLKAADL